jgi:hypothetical protein
MKFRQYKFDNTYIVSTKWNFDNKSILQLIFDIVSLYNLEFYNLVFEIKT